ncbi:MAG: hypothetical protein V2I53_01995 [Paracoccaceae bacterium]|jgi:hypothetical protein|nr:hypothetical protein [Paracoccaceae bacterium]
MTNESFDVIPAAEIYDGVRLATDTTPEMGTMSAPKGVALVLHGFDLMKNHQPGQALLVAVDWLRFKLEKQGYQVIFGRYNTHQSFVYGAQEIAAYLKNNNIPTNNLSIFAYSMGGLVARQMIANGLTPKRLFTYCTPHLGTMLHVPPINHGAMSMMPVSQDLGKLNKNATETAFRKNVTAIGFSHANPSPQLHDGVVDINSATGVGLGFGRPVHWLSMRVGPQLPLDPHGAVQNLPDIEPALSMFVGDVLKG